MTLVATVIFVKFDFSKPTDYHRSEYNDVKD